MICLDGVWAPTFCTLWRPPSWTRCVWCPILCMHVLSRSLKLHSHYALKHQIYRRAHRGLQHHFIATTALHRSWYMDDAYKLEPLLAMCLHIRAQPEFGMDFLQIFIPLFMKGLRHTKLVLLSWRSQANVAKLKINVSNVRHGLMPYEELHYMTYVCIPLLVLI